MRPNPVPVNFSINGLPSFLGVWYEIARLPVPLGGTDNTIEFTSAVKRVVVVRTTKCLWGMPIKASHKALVLNEENTKFHFTRGFVRNMWILRTDCDFYAVMGSPNHARLHIYSRRPGMDKELYAHLVDKAAKMGYDTSQLVKTLHRPTMEHPAGQNPFDKYHVFETPRNSTERELEDED
jgi:lipocalin